MTEEADPRFTRKQKLAGALGTAASIATILTLFLTAGGGSPAPAAPSQPPQDSPAAQVAYPAQVQANFMASCEASASAASCGCALGFFEANVPLTRFAQDEVLVSEGQLPPDVVNAENACG